VEKIDNNKIIFEKQADICKVLANATRLEIIYILKKDEMNVNNLAAKVGASKASISQHLSLLKDNGVVTSRKDGLNVFYKISNKKFIAACDTMRDLMYEQLDEMISTSKEILEIQI